MQVRVDGEWGSIRDVEELIADGEMPELYNEVIKALENTENKF